MPVITPFIPSEITVHLGAPDAAAENVTVPFVEYIKNVASGEIYPTWPEASQSKYICNYKFCFKQILYRMVSFKKL